MGSQAEPAEGERKRLLEVRTGSQCQLSANMRLRGAFGALPMVLVLMVHETLAEDLFTPSKCVSTIVSCCNPDQPVGQHPFRCLMCISLSTPGIINPPSAGDSFEKHIKKPGQACLLSPGVLR